jgi:MFS family permease
MLVLSRWAGQLLDRHGARLPLTVGPLITAIGYTLFALASQDGHYWTSFFSGVLVISLGMTVTVAPLTTTIMNAIPKSHAGVASGINNAVSRLASLIAIAAFGALLVMIFVHVLEHQLAALNLPAEEIARIRASRLQLAAIQATDVLATRAITVSFIRAYRIVIWIAASLTLTGAIVGWAVIKPAPSEA